MLQKILDATCRSRTRRSRSGSRITGPISGSRTANRVRSAISRTIPQCSSRSAAKACQLQKRHRIHMGLLKNHTTGGPPTMPAPGEEAPNHLTLFVADDGAITYELASRKNGKSSGKIDLNKPLTTGWADWQLVVDKTMPQRAAADGFHASEIGANISSLVRCGRFARWRAPARSTKWRNV